MRAQLEDQMAQTLDRAAHGRQELVQDLELLGIGQLVPQELEPHARGHDLLDGIVVDVAGDPLALVLLGVDEAGQQPASLFVHALDLAKALREVLRRLGDLDLEIQVLRQELDRYLTVIRPPR
jgi:hypothetical protein